MRRKWLRELPPKGSTNDVNARLANMKLVSDLRCHPGLWTELSNATAGRISSLKTTYGYNFQFAQRNHVYYIRWVGPK